MQKRVYVSIEEPVEYLRGFIQDYRMSCGNVVAASQQYDTGPFMQQMLGEIFYGTGTMQQSGLLGSTRTLITDGVEVNTAVMCALHVFKLLVDVLAVHYPSMEFSNAGVSGFEIKNQYDLVVQHF